MNTTTAYKKLRAIQRKIKEKRAELKEVSSSHYYCFVVTETERRRDVIEIESEIKDLLDLEFAAMENLQRSAELAKADNQYARREILAAQNSNNTNQIL